MLSPHPLTCVLSSDLNMAAKFIVAVALFAVCHSSPVLINGANRDGRSYSIGQAYNSGGGVSTAQANVHGDVAQAYGSSNGGAPLARDGYVYPGQAIAQAQTYNAPQNYGASQALAEAQNGPYYPVPAPATLVSYEQNFAVPTEVVYEVPSPISAQSSAVTNGASDSSVASATSNGAGVAQSSANTRGGVGSYGATSSNAQTYGSGFGSANSNANSGYGSASTSAKSQGQGSALSAAQSNGVAGVAYPVVPAVFDARAPIFHTAYVPSVPIHGVASSNANVIGSGKAASAAKVSRGISWRFGTLYDNPPAAHAQANTYSGYGAAKSATHTHGYGSANANANTYGAGHGSANADANSAGYGAAKSAANVHGSYYGGSRTSADAHTHGSGHAASSARSQGVSTAYRVTNSQANSSGFGSAHSNAQAL